MGTLPLLMAPDSTGLSSSPSSFTCLFSHQSPWRSHHVSTAGRRRHAVYPTVSSCAGGNNTDHDLLRSLQRFDRRNVVLGGLSGLAGLGLNHAAAFSGTPIAPPDLSKCHSATVQDDDTNPTVTAQLECCPPFSDKAVDFTFPTVNKLRVRPATHLVDEAYLEKFERAIKLMKDLPQDDPLNFYQQANVHCAYCNDAYDQVGIPNAHKDQLHIQVHSSWVFLPWHRIYLYFFERTLGKLIGDENFAMPFWNWDHPDGMMMPNIYTHHRSSLFNPNRDQRHLPPATIILDYDGTDPPCIDRDRQIRQNLATMYRTMVANGKTAELFMGAKFVTGNKPSPGAGSLELVPHNAIHTWCGNPQTPFNEDMGNLYSAGRDCLFFAHHSNVDRMWDVWTKVLKKHNFDDPDWLNAAFYFYDENRQLVKVKIADALDSQKLGYTYEARDLPWLYTAPARRTFQPAQKVKETAAKTAAAFPLTLSSAVSAIIKRPRTSRSYKEKASEEEVLVIQDIELEKTLLAKFDVYVNTLETADLTPTAAEHAGSFTNVPHKKKQGAKNIMPLQTNLRLGLSELLTEIGAEDEDTIVVTLVPRKGVGMIKIGGIGIEYIKIR